jgi:hypothetical protein
MVESLCNMRAAADPGKDRGRYRWAVGRASPGSWKAVLAVVEMLVARMQEAVMDLLVCTKDRPF